MSTTTRKRIGAGVLVVGWSLVVAGAVRIATALATGAGAGAGAGARDERAGLGLAVIMAGLLVVLAGNYIHHRARVATGSGMDTEPGNHRPEPGRSVEP